MISATILLALLQLISCHNNLPEDWTKCHRSDPNLNACLKTAVQDAIVQLGENGIPSLDVKLLDPMGIKQVEVQQKGKSSSMSLKITFRNAKLYGLSKSSVIKFEAHLDKNVLEGETTTPIIWFEADYILEGQIFVIPVTGRGKCNVTMNEMKIAHHLIGKRVEREGEVYLELEKYKTTITGKGIHADFNNLFNANRIFGEIVNRIINDNTQVIFEEIRSPLERDVGNIFLDYANGIFKKVPYDNIFLP